MLCNNCMITWHPWNHPEDKTNICLKCDGLGEEVAFNPVLHANIIIEEVPPPEYPSEP